MLPKQKSINIGTKSKVKIKYLYFILQNKIDGKALKVKMIKFPVKLPTKDRTCIIYRLEANTIDGINQGNPVNKCALKYSNTDKKIIIIKIGDLFFLVINFAHKNAHPQKKASMQGKITTDSGIRNIL